MGNFSLSSSTAHNVPSNEAQKTSHVTTHHSESASSGCCPFLLQTVQPSAVYNTTGKTSNDSSGSSRCCHAVTTPFTPSAVHQSSCCLNPGNFARCPYYVEAKGEQKRQLELQARHHSFVARLRKRIARLLHFGRTDHKRRKRVYFVI